VRLLVITTTGLIPRPQNPTAGIFFANFVRQLRGLTERIVLVTPQPFVPWPLTHFNAFAYHRLPFHGKWADIEVHRPAYFSTRMVRHLWLQSRNFCAAAMPVCRALHRRHHFDIVIGYSFGPPAHTAQCVAHALGLRSVSWAIGSDVHTHPQLSEENMRLLRHTVRHADLVLTESDALRRVILDFCPVAGNVHAFYKGIDLDDLRAESDLAAARAELGLAADRTYMVSLGRMVKTKGVYEFYEAFRNLAGRWPRLAALWIGGGPEENALAALARRDGMADRFAVLGSVPRAKALRLLQAADLMAFASHAEGLPNAVMEAMAAGLPIVATDVGGDREVIVDGVTGLLVPPQNVDTLVAGVERILQNPAEARRMGQRGRHLILDHFDVTRNAAVALQVLRFIAAGGDADNPIPSCAGMAAGELPTGKSGGL
jgi:teichuronic acid biosynthesis glycosyltransferase TuaC